MTRRVALAGLAGAPLLALERRAQAADYTSAGEVFTAIDALEAEVSLRLRALSEALPPARALVTSVLRDHERHRAARSRLRARLGLPAAAPPPRAGVADLLSLASLRTAQEALVHAHAEGLGAIGDEIAVDALARQMVDLSRHLTVIDLWIETEESRG